MGRRKLVYDPKFTSARRRAEKGFDILAEPPEEDNDLGAGSTGPRDACIVNALVEAKHARWLQLQRTSSQEGRVKAEASE